MRRKKDRRRHHYFGGGKEIGEQGREIEEKIRRIASAGSFELSARIAGIIRPGHTSTRALPPRCPWPEIWLLFPERRHLFGDSRSSGKGVHRLQPFCQHRFHAGHDFGDIIDYLGNDPSAKISVVYRKSDEFPQIYECRALRVPDQTNNRP